MLIEIGDQVFHRDNTVVIGMVAAIHPTAKDKYGVWWGKSKDNITFVSAQELLVLPEDPDYPRFPNADNPRLDSNSENVERCVEFLVNLFKRHGYGGAGFTPAFLRELGVPEEIVHRYTA